MNQYLVWNIKYNQWRMNEFVGFTDDGEFAGLFTEEWLRGHTGIYDSRTGDYAYNLIVNSTTFDKSDFSDRLVDLSSSQKKALKRAIMKERKKRGLSIEIIEEDGKKICPYCKRQLVIIKIIKEQMKCGKCNNAIMDIEEW